MKPSIIQSNYNAVIPDLYKYFRIYDFDKIDDADAILVWNEVLGNCQIAALYGEKNSIPTYIVQHGIMWGDSSPTELEQHKVKTTGARYFAWSQYSKDKFIRSGVKEEDITITGAPIFRDIVPRLPMSGNKVLFAPTHHCLDHVNVSKQSKTIWDKISSMDWITPYIKLLSAEHDDDKYPGNKIYSNRYAGHHSKNVYQTLNQVDLIVTQDEGTLNLFAYSLDIPVVNIKGTAPEYTNACDHVDLADLPEAIKENLANRDKRKAERREVVLKHGGDPAENRSADIIANKIITDLKERLWRPRPIQQPAV